MIWLRVGGFGLGVWGFDGWKSDLGRGVGNGGIRDWNGVVGVSEM